MASSGSKNSELINSPSPPVLLSPNPPGSSYLGTSLELGRSWGTSISGSEVYWDCSELVSMEHSLLSTSFQSFSSSSNNHYCLHMGKLFE